MTDTPSDSDPKAAELARLAGEIDVFASRLHRCFDGLTPETRVYFLKSLDGRADQLRRHCDAMLAHHGFAPAAE